MTCVEYQSIIGSCCHCEYSELELENSRFDLLHPRENGTRGWKEFKIGASLVSYGGAIVRLLTLSKWKD